MKTNARFIQQLGTGALGALMISMGMIAGCASMPPPKEQLAVAQTAVNDAMRSGAPQYAPAEIKLAQDKLDRARSMVDDKENKEAGRLAEEAEIDARMAEAKAAEAKAQQAATQVRQSLDVLRQEIERNKQPATNQGG